MNMNSPQLGDHYFKERAGICAVAGIINDLQCIWRETSNADVGIDGQIEHLDKNGHCTGRIVAAQIKSGPSFFENATPTHFRFWAEEKHRRYWCDFPVPVALILYDPNRRCAFWTDARRQLRSPNRTNSSSPIEVPKTQMLDQSHREQFFETSGPIDGTVLNIGDLIRYLAETVHSNPGFNVSYLDLFAIGLTDNGRKLFYSMGTACEIAEARAVIDHGLNGFNIGPCEQDFCGKFIRFLVAQNIIHYDFTDFLIDLEDRQLQPTILCSLTVRGIRLLKAIQEVAGADRGAFRGNSIALMDECLEKLPTTLAQLKVVQTRIACSSDDLLKG